MFKKILISEDFGTYNIAIKKILEDLGITDVDQVFYCDDALIKINKSFIDNKPYDLLITDLSFKPDHREEIMEGGEDLIQEVKKKYPQLKIIVLSIENRVFKINSIFEKYDIDAFVTKGRNDAEELKKALLAVYNNDSYMSPATANSKFDNVSDLTEVDYSFLKLLKSGLTVLEVSEKFKKEKIYPNSESHLKKRLMIIREMFRAKDTKELIGQLSDMGLFNKILMINVYI